MLNSSICKIVWQVSPCQLDVHILPSCLGQSSLSLLLVKLTLKKTRKPRDHHNMIKTHCLAWATNGRPKILTWWCHVYVNSTWFTCLVDARCRRWEGASDPFMSQRGGASYGLVMHLCLSNFLSLHPHSFPCPHVPSVSTCSWKDLRHRSLIRPGFTWFYMYVPYPYILHN